MRTKMLVRKKSYSEGDDVDDVLAAVLAGGESLLIVGDALGEVGTGDHMAEEDLRK
jgi:hypothetical protein